MWGSVITAPLIELTSRIIWGHLNQVTYQHPPAYNMFGENSPNPNPHILTRTLTLNTVEGCHPTDGHMWSVEDEALLLQRFNGSTPLLAAFHNTMVSALP